MTGRKSALVESVRTMLFKKYPREVLFSLIGVDSGRAEIIRSAALDNESLWPSLVLSFTGRSGAVVNGIRTSIMRFHPMQVAQSLMFDGGTGNSLRRQLLKYSYDAVACSLIGVPMESWPIGVTSDFGAELLLKAITGNSTKKADDIRLAQYRKYPEMALLSLQGVATENAWGIRMALAKDYPVEFAKSLSNAGTPPRRMQAQIQRVVDSSIVIRLLSLRGDYSLKSIVFRKALMRSHPLLVARSLMMLPHEGRFIGPLFHFLLVLDWTLGFLGFEAAPLLGRARKQNTMENR